MQTVTQSRSSGPQISGFTVIRNARLMGYPVVESIKSLLPIVDEMVVGVGQSDDGTRELIEAIGDPRIRIFDAHWDLQKIKGGLILSEKTNEALDQCAHDWCVYIQADEIIHERDLATLHGAIASADRDPQVEGMLFGYVHFYGSYSVIATSRRWYRNEIRAVRKSSGARSHNDAQGFRVDGRKLNVRRSGAQIYHYGWVKPPRQMGEKTKLLSRFWHGTKMDRRFDDFQYDRQYGLRPYAGSHPRVMQALVDAQDWNFDYRRGILDWTLKDLNLAASDAFERVFGRRIGEYRPYRLLR